MEAPVARDCVTVSAISKRSDSRYNRRLVVVAKCGDGRGTVQAKRGKCLLLREERIARNYHNGLHSLV